MEIRLHGYLEEDLQDYKKAGMFLAFPSCSFKCAKEIGKSPEEICQNYFNIKETTKLYDLDFLWCVYDSNPLTESFILGGLEPLDTFDDVLSFIDYVRNEKNCEADIVIYTGYYEEEIKGKIDTLKKYANIYMKCGRYRPDQERHFDEVLGVKLANKEQKGIKIS